MVFAVAFLLVAVVFAGYAVVLGGWAWVVLWPAASFAAVGLGYAGLGVRVFGKRADGGHGWLHFATLLPFLGMTGLAWHLRRIFDREPVWHEVLPGVFAGRRAFVRELPPGIELVAASRCSTGHPSTTRRCGNSSRKSRLFPGRCTSTAPKGTAGRGS